MTLNSYQIGNAIVLSAVFRDALTLLPADPVTVKLRILDPTETETIITNLLAHPSLGIFQYVLVVSIPGIWKYRYTGTGTVQAAGERHFEVIPSSFEPPF